MTIKETKIKRIENQTKRGNRFGVEVVQQGLYDLFPYQFIR
jgi:hypothetical protein